MIATFAAFGAVFSLILFFLLVVLYAINYYKHIQWLRQIFFSSQKTILIEKQSKIDLETKLVQSGITKKEFQQIVAASIVTGLSVIALPFVLKLSLLLKLFIGSVGLAIAVFTPWIYLEEQKKARIKRIERDLAIFIDLLIIILEGGGGLHNAIDQVTQEAKDIIGKDLLEESKRFKYELITYDSELAYNNLIKRTASEAIATIVGFMKLSQETGIGVKTVFENQSNEIKEADMLNIEKKASLMNIAITFTMFIFILPAIIAMIVFPISAGALMDLNF